MKNFKIKWCQESIEADVKYLTRCLEKFITREYLFKIQVSTSVDEIKIKTYLLEHLNKLVMNILQLAITYIERHPQGDINYKLKRIKNGELYYFKLQYIKFLQKEFNYNYHRINNYYFDTFVEPIIKYIQNVIFRHQILN
ncbi:hypothetical protein [Candidatus Phytoplasma pyri]|uniref:hypothetical protein n=1 Tax=Candidatus Phytoplasma pyri TaxID=47566 RepID=UPI003983C70A